MLRSDLCDAYIVVKGTITVADPNDANYNKKLAFKNNAPFTSCISKINNAPIDNAEDLDIVMLMYNLLEYNKNYRKKTGSSWNYYRDEPNSGAGSENNNVNYFIKDSKSFDYKRSITWKLDNKTQQKTDITQQLDRHYITKDAEIVALLKYSSNFWRTLDMPLINCEINLILTWSEKCVITSKATRDAVPDRRGNPPVAAVDNPTNAAFKITGTKWHVLLVPLSTEDDNNFSEQSKSGFKRTIKWNKYRPEMTNQTKTNNLNYLIDSTFNKVDRLFVLSFENKEDRWFLKIYYTPKVETKDFNILVDGKHFFFYLLIKNKDEACKKVMSIGKNNDCTIGNLLDYEYFSNHYKLIAIDLSKQIKLENPDLK